MRYQTIWFRAGKAYLPTIGSPPSGMFFELDPVEIVEPNSERLEAAVTAALQRSAVPLKERSRFDPDWPKQSVVQMAAGYKSWRSFVQRALRIALIEAPDGWHVAVGEGTSAQDVEDVRMPVTSTTQELAGCVREVASRRQIWRAE
jgi:hypothetical protein